MRDAAVITSQETKDNIAALTKAPTIRQMVHETPGWVWSTRENETHGFMLQALEAYDRMRGDDEPQALTIGAVAAALTQAAKDIGLYIAPR